VASAWIERRESGGGTRYRVRFRVGGREAVPRYGGSFKTMREARARRDWVAGELAAMRVPDIRRAPATERATRLRELAEGWRTSRVDVAEGTAATHRVNLRRILPKRGERRIDAIEPGDVAELVAELHAGG
jgi:hypothetical protein